MTPFSFLKEAMVDWEIQTYFIPGFWTTFKLPVRRWDGMGAESPHSICTGL